ncbi:5-oxoprolinase subunit C family protein [Salinimonas chungwhensis]|uniref:5-oxoprolinase subunit C family protein n=1 Tax=Salinimonas chungwhensis TaxID=265425 RepID=UPI00036E8E37|nr:biotin-dependent carboxyltransferase family protein [Salinimonas chungwhensis]
MAEITLLNSGLQTLVVDAGRQPQAQEIGFCASGAVDLLSFELVNWLCANPLDTPALECIGEVVFSVSHAMEIAVGGPAVSVQQNGDEVSAWQSINLAAGDTVTVSPRRLGTKSYIGLGGVLDLPAIKGSKTIVTREGVGGIHNDGKSLQKDDTLPVAVHSIQAMRELEAHEIPDYTLETPLDVVVGYQQARFDNWQQQLFFASEYTVSNDINRMGYRLTGQAIEVEPEEMYSEGINCGAIQFPPDGQPIVMLADRQTLGGYPKIGCVADYDIYRLAQAVPGDVVTFRAIDADNARGKWLLWHRLEELIFDSHPNSSHPETEQR